MPDTGQSISLPFLLAILRRHRRVIIATVLVALAASIALSAVSERVYTATAIIGFNDESADLQALGTPASPSFQPDKEAAAQAERITRPEIVDGVRRRVGSELTRDELQDAIRTEVGATTNLVYVIAEASSAKLSADIANGFSQALQADATNRARSRYRAAAVAARVRASRLRGPADVSRRVIYEDQASRLLALATFSRPVDIVRAAGVPSGPTSPRPVRNAVLALLLGGMLGVGIAFLRNSLDRRLRDPGDVGEYVDAPVVGYLRTGLLGSTPFSPNGSGPPGDDEVEPYRILRSNVTFLGVDKDVRLLLVTSPLPEEGKSTVAAGLAWADAMAGKRTLLVDCDLRRPVLASRFGLDPVPGLSDYLVGEATPADAVRLIPGAKGSRGESLPLAFVPAGRPVSNHSELLTSDRFSAFLSEVTSVYDRVVLDTAPLLPVSDTLSVLPHVDGLLLCVRLGQTTRDQALAAATALSHFPSKPSGLVLTAADEVPSSVYVGEYGYAYYGEDRSD